MLLMSRFSGRINHGGRAGLSACPDVAVDHIRPRCSCAILKVFLVSLRVRVGSGLVKIIPADHDAVNQAIICQVALRMWTAMVISFY
jgi:hypothetical protein